MKIKHNEPIGLSKQSPDKTIRSTARMPQHAVRCNLGQVIDLSPKGMSVLAERAPSFSGNISIELYTMDKHFNLKGRVVWTERTGQFQTTMGIEFIRVSRDEARHLELVARMNRRRGGSFRQAG